MAAADIAVEGDKLWDWPPQENGEFVKLVEDSNVEFHLDAELFAKEFQALLYVKVVAKDFIQVNMDHEARKGDGTNASRNIMRCYKLLYGADPSAEERS